MNVNVEKAAEKAIELLECHSCKEILIEPIYTCKTWHPVCGYCFPKMARQTCYCSRELAHSKCANRLLRVVFPELKCRNESYGCNYSCSPAYLTSHLKTCEYRTIICPIQGRMCRRRLCPPLLFYHHLKVDHNLDFINGEVSQPSDAEMIFSHKLSIPYDWLRSDINERTFIVSNSCEFLFCFSVTNGNITWWMCTNSVMDICNKFCYDTCITTNTTADGEVILSIGKHLPVNGVRCVRKTKLMQTNGVFSACCLATLFYKRYKCKPLELEDSVEVEIKIRVTTSNDAIDSENMSTSETYCVKTDEVVACE